MQSEAERELEEFERALADIERDVTRFERSEAPHDKTGLASLRWRIGLAKDALAAKTWTSNNLANEIEGLESRLRSLERL